MSEVDEVTVEVDQGIVFPLLTSGANDNEVGEVRSPLMISSTSLGNMFHFITEYI